MACLLSIFLPLFLFIQLGSSADSDLPVTLAPIIGGGNGCLTNGDCSNHGVCNSRSQCECQLGWIGASCNRWACESRPCPIGQVCIGVNLCQSVTENNSPKTTTEAVISENRGRNNIAVDSDIDDEIFESHFDTEAMRGQCFPACKNGRCIAPGNVCRCYTGYDGVDCAEPQCRNGCGRNGFCASPGKCSCLNGWTGARCLVPPQPPRTAPTTTTTSFNRSRCRVGDCGNGRCLPDKNVCECLPGYAGSSCLDPICENGCGESHGYCASPNKCHCFSGWSGSDCSAPSPPSSAPLSCPQGCVNGFCNTGTCQCYLGYSGLACDTQILGKAIGAACTKDSDCATTLKNSYCERLSTSCPKGKCQCYKGYVGINNQCLTPKRLDEACDPTKDDIACIENSYCAPSGKCDCKPDFKRGPLNICTRKTAISQLGESCKSSGDCFYDLICMRGTCVCPLGRRVSPDSTYSCVPLDYGDHCSGNRDCAHLPRAECDIPTQTCKCKYGYTLTTYFNEKAEEKLTCAVAKTVINSGSVCPANLEKLCESTYVCITCIDAPNSTPRCLWPSAATGLPPVPEQQPAQQGPIIASSSTPNSQPARIALFISALIIFVINY